MMMRTAGWSFITLIAFAAFVVAFDARDYLLLMTEVNAHFRTACVILVQPNNHEDPRASFELHSCSRELSRRKIFSLVVDFEDILKIIRYKEQIFRPLFVVFLTTRKILEKFMAISGKLHIKHSVWLVLFVPTNNNSLVEFCERPIGNVFNLNFDTEMLVLCQNDTTLKEWYAVQDNRTRTYDFAVWRREEGLVLNTNLSLYVRRSDLFGTVLRVATVKNSPLVNVQNGTISLFFGKVANELSKIMNFKMEFLEPTEFYGSWDKAKADWSGVIGQVSSGIADFGVAEFSLTKERLNAVDFTMPVLMTRNRLYFRQSNFTIHWSTYMRTFSPKIWLTIFILITIIPIFLTVMKTKGRLAMRILSDNYIHIWGVYCQQGLSEFPKDLSTRLAFISIFVSAIIVWATYSAFLISYLTVSSIDLPFTTIADFLLDDSYGLVIFANSAYFDSIMNNHRLSNKVKSKIKPPQELPRSLEVAIKQICWEKLAFYTNEAFMSAGNPYQFCKINFLDVPRTDNLAMCLTKNSPYLETINYYLQRLQDNGAIRYMKGTFKMTNHNPSTLRKQVTLWNIVPIIAVFMSGVVLSLIVLCLERTYDFYKNRGERVVSYVNKWNHVVQTGAQPARKNYLNAGTINAKHKIVSFKQHVNTIRAANEANIFIDK